MKMKVILMATLKVMSNNVRKSNKSLQKKRAFMKENFVKKMLNALGDKIINNGNPAPKCNSGTLPA